jgi:hypothetical protein
MQGFNNNYGINQPGMGMPGASNFPQNNSDLSQSQLGMSGYQHPFA